MCLLRSYTSFNFHSHCKVIVVMNEGLKETVLAAFDSGARTKLKPFHNQVHQHSILQCPWYFLWESFPSTFLTAIPCFKPRTSQLNCRVVLLWCHSSMVLLRAKSVSSKVALWDGDLFLLCHKSIAHLGLTSVSLYGNIR